MCPACRLDMKLGILRCLEGMEVGNDVVEVMILRDSLRQGTKNGVQNSQRELHPEEMTISNLVKEFFDSLDTCIPHYQEIRWVRLMQDTDFARLAQDTLICFTDYAAVMALRAFQAKNSSVDGHAVNDNFVVIYARRSVTRRSHSSLPGALSCSCRMSFEVSNHLD
mmetsp:Transcript_24826/g.42530  ORF Transcript_24826/g.42530 Transcript_24826/m.42530 type:complete len:166 (+) Transcript_24826:991-1488(+)